MSEKQNISIIQFAPVLGRPEKSIEKIDHLFNQVSDTDLVILPELSNSGYNFTSEKQAHELSEVLTNSRYVNFLKEKAREKKCTIVSGINERAEGKLYNSSILLNAEGVKGRYRKLHLFMNEKKFFEPGNDGLPVFEFKGFKLGMLICFDYLFPEIWRVMALKGAALVCHPSNLVTPFGERVVPVQAIMNRIFIATANRVGTESELHFRGRSFLAGTEGQIIMQAESDSECVINSEIDLSAASDKMITEKNHVIKDRRPDMYHEIL